MMYKLFLLYQPSWQVQLATPGRLNLPQGVKLRQHLRLPCPVRQVRNNSVDSALRCTANSLFNADCVLPLANASSKPSGCRSNDSDLQQPRRHHSPLPARGEDEESKEESRTGDLGRITFLSWIYIVHHTSYA